jgi:hypothetical protein
MTPLERELAELGGALRYPATPDAAGAAVARLRHSQAPRARRGWRRRGARTVVVAALVFLLVTGAVAAAVPAVRHAIRDVLELRGATVELRSGPAPSGARFGSDFGVADPGWPVSLGAARAGARFEVVIPGALGAPDAVHFDRRVRGGLVTLIYGDGTSVVITELRTDLNPGVLHKVGFDGNQAQPLRIGAWRAIWLNGPPHVLSYRAGRRHFHHARRRGRPADRARCGARSRGGRAVAGTRDRHRPVAALSYVAGRVVWIVGSPLSTQTSLLTAGTNERSPPGSRVAGTLSPDGWWTM